MPAIAINATRDVRSVAAGETVEPLDALTSLAETMAQSDRPCKRADELCDRDTRAASPAARSGSCTIIIGSQPEHTGVPPAPPLIGWGVHTLQVTTTDTATETSFDRRAASVKVHDLRTQCVASAPRHASVTRRSSGRPEGESEWWEMLNATPAGLPTWSGSCRRAKPPKTGEDGKERTGRPMGMAKRLAAVARRRVGAQVRVCLPRCLVVVELGHVARRNCVYVRSGDFVHPRDVLRGI